MKNRTGFNSFLSFLILLLFVSCTQNAKIKFVDDGNTTEQAVVYGVDDRQDYYASSDEVMRKLTRESIVALMNPWAMNDANAQNITFNGPTLGEAKGLCSDQRFINHPTASFCSGTLIDDDLVVTAGHCVNPADTNCPADVRFVFNYYLDSETTLAPVTSDDVYACQEVVAFALGNSGGRDLDFAIVKLDRPVSSSRVPAQIDIAADQISVGTSVSIVGMGSGMPAKLDNGGKVIDAPSARDRFRATTDSFGGNSGSGVFNNAGEMVGILVAGQRDYVNQGGCAVVNTFPESGSGGGESVTYVQRAIDQLCSTGWPSARLCNAEAVCGDEKCTGTENTESCPADCTPVCGNNRCEVGEDAACPEDCGSGVAEGWTCEDGFFGTRDGCDCGCGARDPDCDVPSQQIYNCSDGEICGETGICETILVPAEWICELDYYGTKDGCDCNCGALDPDCDDVNQAIYGCADGEFCVENGVCSTEPDAANANGENPEGESTAPSEWTCSDSYFAAEDGCDCNCGAYDPDCDDDNAVVLGCFSGACLSSGVCEESGCAHVSTENVRGEKSFWGFAFFLVPIGILLRKKKTNRKLGPKRALSANALHGLWMGLLLSGMGISFVACSSDAPVLPAKGEVLSEKEGLQAKKEGLQAKKEGLQAKKEGLQAKKEGLQAKKEGLQAKKDGQGTQKDGQGTQKEAAHAKKKGTSSKSAQKRRAKAVKLKEGAACDTALQCQSGICEGKGCGKKEGICTSSTRICTKDHRAYCGCDGKTFYGSGSCPEARYKARRPCEAL